MRRVFSGIQPTGAVHLGNYFGALQNWASLAREGHQCTFCVVDLHALSSGARVSHLAERTRETAAMLLACGVDEQSSLLYRQSAVPEHPRLMWLLSPLVNTGRLGRMTQFKDKGGDNESEASLALFSYPVLQAADIILFNAQAVPVGEDQRQHLELARHLASALRKRTGLKISIPEPLFTHVPRVKSLSDPTSKMSKSSSSEAGVLYLKDSDDVIARKIRRAVTDSEAGITWDPEGRPGVSSLLLLEALARGEKTEAQALERHARSNKGELKESVTEAVLELVRPIRARYEELMADKSHVDAVLDAGDAQARKFARSNYQRIWNAINSAS